MRGVSLLLLAAVGWVVAASPTNAADEVRAAIPVASPTASGANAYVLRAIREMPTGGRYAIGKIAFDGLGQAIRGGEGGLLIRPSLAQPSFCSGATYLVFLHALEAMRERGALRLDDATVSALLVAGQRDGQGVWGRWNANGPGTARLFTELNLGRNFTDYAEARPGDFMKIFWTSEIGARERGHSVIFLEAPVVNGVPYLRFWSSNTARQDGEISGYGEKLIPRSRVARAIFSRLETPANINSAPNLPRLDGFLASMLSKRASMDEVRKMCAF